MRSDRVRTTVVVASGACLAVMALALLNRSTPTETTQVGPDVSSTTEADPVVVDEDLELVVAAAAAARATFGLDEGRTLQAVTEGRWNAEQGLYLFDDEVGEVIARRRAQMSSADVFAEAARLYPETFAGGWYDPESGGLVVGFTSVDDRISFSELYDGSGIRLDTTVLRNSQADLEAARAEVERIIVESPEGSARVSLIGIHPVHNAVMVGVYSDVVDEVLEQLSAFDPGLFSTFPIERPAAEQPGA